MVLQFVYSIHEVKKQQFVQNIRLQYRPPIKEYVCLYYKLTGKISKVDTIRMQF